MSDGIYVKILGDDSDLQSKLSSSSKAVAKWGAAAVAAGAAATAALVKSGLASADAQAKLAAQLGTTSEDMAIMSRSADMAGIAQGKMASASRDLTTRLSQAANGTGEAAAALDKLGLSVEEVQALPLTERIATINEALQNNVAASDRAAVAAQLYGRNAGLAMSRIDPATIRTATDQVRSLGAALSEVEAAQVEAANDAMSAIGLATEGASKKLAAQFAPALEAAATALTDLIADSDAFGNISTKVFNASVKGAGYVANAWRGIQIVLDGLTVAYAGVKAAALSVALAIGEGVDSVVAAGTRSINGLIKAANKIPGINMAEMVRNEPESLAMLRKWAEDANEEMSAAIDTMHNRMMEPLPSEQLDAWVSAAVEASVERAEAVAEARAKEREEQQEFHEETVDIEREQYEARLQMLEDYEAAKAGTIRLWSSDQIKTAEDMAKAQKAIDQATLRARLQVASSMMGNLSSLMDTENRKLFNIGKAAALAQATIDGYQSIVSSYAQGAKIGGPAVGAAFAATAGIATGVQISRIASASYGSGGGGGVPAAAATSNPNVDSSQMVGGSGGGAQQERVFRLEGLDPNSMYSGDQLMRLADSLVELQNDGYRLIPS